ncbi:MAG: hypothetical protein ACM3ZV_04870 [Bacillota bacterium]
MVRMRAAPVHLRFALTLALGLLLALRSLAPAGFMPAFDHGALTIVACPDAPSPMHHHGEQKSLHQPCPYAAAAGLHAVAPDWQPLATAFSFFAVALLLGRTFLFVVRHDRRERPPAIGPPIAA